MASFPPDISGNPAFCNTIAPSESDGKSGSFRFLKKNTKTAIRLQNKAVKSANEARGRIRRG